MSNKMALDALTAYQAAGIGNSTDFAKQAETLVHVEDDIRAFADATCAMRASSGAAQAVRMLTREELNDVALSEQVGWGPGEYVEAVQRKFAEVNGLRIPADGKIGGAA